MNWVVRKAGYCTEPYSCCLPKLQWHILARTAKIEWRNFVSICLSSPASCFFHFFLCLSLAFPSLDINNNPHSRGSVNTRNYQVLTPFIVCLQCHSHLLWVLHVGDIPCFLKRQRTGSNYKPREKSKQGCFM